MNRLEMVDIEKSFSSVSVLKRVSFSVTPGEVHALLGVNGAGKSTLMKILAGDYEKDAGKILLSGVEININSPDDALKHGIGIVVQEVDTALIPSLSVAENVTLHLLKDGPAFISWKKRKQKARELLAQVHCDVDVNQLVSQCSLQEKQLILIARAVAQNVKYLILDEPTAPLSNKETKVLFEVIKKLKAADVGIIYISHRMPEIKEITDRLTIMRDGQVVEVAETKELTIEDIIQTMLGKTLTKTSDHRSYKTSEELLRIENLRVFKTKQQINLTVHKGEIIGIAGLVGAGKTETARALFGADPAVGTRILHNKAVNVSSPQQAVVAGISLVPEERRKEGVLVDFSVIENLALPSLANFSKWFVNINKQKEEVKIIEKLSVKTASPFTKVRHLSGGNQQKVAIGKWLNINSDLFIFDEPTKGIDIGAKEEVFALIRGLAEEKKGILYFSGEFDEILNIADRILVMYDGEIVKEFTRDEATYEKMMHAATGGVENGANR
ncbi:sugar ABC transporter ATP-binding protein [Bacillus taeanensis]|uniref:Autoinducer 2 import ATP-binding protein LsrA n=1 Tax=Bacillus taeanensis TaxID=273032 RepID=A0A366XZC3_9BACI|nr:sugar ABC transporter ATP-binding protein [Bacillus taeanensis]RBW69503.1 sugar ABC transporter ATP-binding protein [Bacillus taeanensis]